MSLILGFVIGMIVAYKFSDTIDGLVVKAESLVKNAIKDFKEKKEPTGSDDKASDKIEPADTDEVTTDKK